MICHFLTYANTLHTYIALTHWFHFICDVDCCFVGFVVFFFFFAPLKIQCEILYIFIDVGYKALLLLIKGKWHAFHEEGEWKKRDALSHLSFDFSHILKDYVQHEYIYMRMLLISVSSYVLLIVYFLNSGNVPIC